jgi:hypothetical protein
MKKIIISNVLFILCLAVTSTFSQKPSLTCRGGLNGTVRAVLKPGQKKAGYNNKLMLNEIAETKYDNAQSHQKVKVPYYILGESDISTVIERIVPKIGDGNYTCDTKYPVILIDEKRMRTTGYHQYWYVQISGTTATVRAGASDGEDYGVAVNLQDYLIDDQCWIEVDYPGDDVIWAGDDITWMETPSDPPVQCAYTYRTGLIPDAGYVKHTISFANDILKYTDLNFNDWLVMDVGGPHQDVRQIAYTQHPNCYVTTIWDFDNGYNSDGGCVPFEVRRGKKTERIPINSLLSQTQLTLDNAPANDFSKGWYPFRVMENYPSNLSVDNFTPAEQSSIHKAANFWNQGGTALYFDKGLNHLDNNLPGKDWSLDYCQTRFSAPNGDDDGSRVSHNFEFWYPYGIMKVVQPIMYRGAQIWPEDASTGGECMIYNKISHFIEGYDGLEGNFCTWQILINAIPGQSNLLTTNPEDIDEAYISKTKIPMSSLTWLVAHELGHAVGLDHDLEIYACKSDGGNNLKLLYEKMFNAYCHDNGDGTSVMKTALTSNYITAVNRYPYLKDLDGYVYSYVLGANQPENCGGTTYSIKKWSWVKKNDFEKKSEFQDEYLYRYPLSVMFTGQAVVDDITPCVGIPLKSWSFANFGGQEYLSPVSIDYNPTEEKYKETPSWNYMNRLYPYTPITTNQAELPLFNECNCSQKVVTPMSGKDRKNKHQNRFKTFVLSFVKL